MTTALVREPELVAAEVVRAARGATVTIDAAVVERVLIHGDLRQLSPAQKVSYYKAVCDSVGLNPLTQPFQYLVLNGKEILYALRAATEQLRQIHSVSVQIMAREVMEDCYIVTARATLPTGRQDENIGAVPIAGLKGENRANAMMKAETKAKRRVTLAICGLGMLDETEVESIHVEAPTPQASAAPADREERETRAATGEIRGTLPHTFQPSGAPTLPNGAVYIVRVDHTPTKNPKVTKHLLTTSTGETYSTIKDRLAALATTVMQDHDPVRVTGTQTRWGLELESLTPIEADGPVHTVDDDDDITF